MSKQLQTPKRYRVGDLVIDLSTFRVTDGDREIAMPKLSFDLLAALARRAPDVVSVDTLMEDVWGQVVVADETVGQRVKLVRDALGDGRRKYIATVRGRGFRLTVPVSPESFPAESSKEPADGPEARATTSPAAAPRVARLSEAEPRAAAEPDRRQLTVMFCDLVGAAALAERLELEALRELLRICQARCAEVVARYDGNVARFVGDGLLVYFGYPRAHEEDAERAVRAALGIVEAIAVLNAETGEDIELAVRIGIATGLVLVGDLIGEGAAEQHAVVGVTPSLAARLHAFAPANAVVIAASTRDLVADRFAYEDLGAHAIDGLSAPIRAWRVLRTTGAHSRFKVAHPGALTPLVGRQDEIDLLRRRWAQAKTGEGQVVLLSGEPGIGKSRICHAFHDDLGKEPHTRLRYQCSPYHSNSALYPFIRQLERASRFEQDDTDEQKLDKLEALLAQACARVGQVAPLLAALLSLSGDKRYAPFTMSAQKQKDETLQALLGQLDGLAAQKPVLVIFEDAHWIDPSSEELLDMIVDQVERLPVFALITFRPEYTATWTGASQVTMLTINRLSAKQAASMVEAIGSVRLLPEELREQIVARTDGVPLFIEELTQSVLASEPASPAPGRTIPSTLYDSLTARLDQLGSAREVAQLAAVIGREFSYKLLAAVADADPEELLAVLDRITLSGLVSQRGVAPEATYTFKHALIQDAAYQSLLIDRRRHHHARIAKAIEEQFPDWVEVEPEFLAHHYTEAGLIEPAVTYWQRAGERAVARSAHVEAIGHLRKGLAVVPDLADSTQRDKNELMLRIALGPPLIATKGYGAPEVQGEYTRARELWQEAGDTAQLCPILYGLWTFHSSRADYRTSRALCADLLAAADEAKSAESQLDAHVALTCTSFLLGNFNNACEHGAHGMALYDSERHRAHALQNPGVCCGAISATALWYLGHPEQARRRRDETLELARELAHPFSSAIALTWLAMLNQCRGDAVAVRSLAEEAMAISSKQSLPFWLGVAAMLRGWAMIEQELVDEGAGQMREGAAIVDATGAQIWTPFRLFLLAVADEKTGHIDKARRRLSEALRAAERTDERHWEAEIHRCKGEILVGESRKHVAEAINFFEQAIDVARQQSAKSLELRATTSLARSWCEQGHRKEAIDLLTPIYGWFSEGSETADLKEAKTLLDEIQ